MKAPKLEIRLLENHLFNKSVITDLNIIPFPCAIYIRSSGEVFLNSYICKLLGFKNNHEFNINKLIQLNPSLQTVLYKENLSSKKPAKKIKLELLDGSHEYFKIKSRHITNEQIGDVFLIFLSKFETNSAIYSDFSLLLIKNEIMQLRQYLDDAGLRKLENILKKHFDEKTKSLQLEDMIVYENDLQSIQKGFPVLSRREVLICTLLSNKFSTADIAKLLNRSTNSVAVTIHRINKKLNFQNRRELKKKLKDMVADNQKKQ